MDVKINFSTTDPNIIGELLRDWLFVGGYGCYETFDVRDEAMPMTQEEAIELIESSTIQYWSQDPEDVAYRRSDMKLCGTTGYRVDFGNQVMLEAAWYWDGDGILLCRLWSGDPYAMDGSFEDIRVINTDCKKSYGWEFADTSAIVR